MTPKSFTKVMSFVKSPKSFGAKQLPCATDNSSHLRYRYCERQIDICYRDMI
jgi:hypothetical protein